MELVPLDLMGIAHRGGPDAPASNRMTETQADQVATQFEAVFMSMLSKQLRESLEEGFFGGENSDTYGAMFDMFLGQHLAEAGGIGLKQMVVSRYAEMRDMGDEVNDHQTSKSETP